MRNLCLAGILAVCTVAFGLTFPTKASAQVISYPQYADDFATTYFGIQQTWDPHIIVHGPIASIDNHREPIWHQAYLESSRRAMTGGLLSQAAVLGGTGCGSCGVISQPAVLNGCDSCGSGILSQSAVYEGGVAVAGPAAVAVPGVALPGYVYPSPLHTDSYQPVDLGAGVYQNF